MSTLSTSVGGVDECRCVFKHVQLHMCAMHTCAGLLEVILRCYYQSTLLFEVGSLSN